jgi:hypothetical protein
VWTPLLSDKPNDKKLATKEGKCRSSGKSKERLTILLAAKFAGHKLQPFVVSKANQIRCF